MRLDLRKLRFRQPKLVATHLCLLFGSRESRHYVRANTFMGPDPRKHLLVAVSLLIISGPIFRAAMLTYGANDVAVVTLTPACFDALGFGALLALLREMPRAHAMI